MFPILYGKKDFGYVDGYFDNKGLGTLSDAISCRITEERNGAYELQLVYPTEGYRAKQLVVGAFIKAKASPISNNLQIFRIYQIEKDLGNKITVSAEHISYILNGFPVPVYSTQGGTNKTLGTVFSEAKNASLALLDSAGRSWLELFNFSTDITGTYGFDIKTPFSMRSLLGGVEGRFLDKANGEYRFDNFDIHLYKNRGIDKGVVVSYGRNLTSLSLDNNDNSCYSHILPYATATYSEEGQDSQELVVFSGGTVSQNPLGFPEVLPLSYSNNNGSFTSDCNITKVKIVDISEMFGENETVNCENVKAKANSYISKRRTEIGKNTETLDVSYQSFGKGYGLSDQIAADEVNLCDTVTVVYPELGINKKLEVNKTIFNVLTERYDGVDIGTPKSSFSDTIRNEVMT